MKREKKNSTFYRYYPQLKSLVIFLPTKLFTVYISKLNRVWPLTRSLVTNVFSSPRRLYHFCLYFEINLSIFLKYALHSILLAYNLKSTSLRLKVDQLTTFASWDVPTVTVSPVWFMSGGKQSQFWLGGIPRSVFN